MDYSICLYPQAEWYYYYYYWWDGHDKLLSKKIRLNRTSFQGSLHFCMLHVLSYAHQETSCDCQWDEEIIFTWFSEGLCTGFIRCCKLLTQRFKIICVYLFSYQFWSFDVCCVSFWANTKVWVGSPWRLGRRKASLIFSGLSMLPSDSEILAPFLPLIPWSLCLFRTWSYLPPRTLVIALNLQVVSGCSPNLTIQFNHICMIWFAPKGNILQFLSLG